MALASLIALTFCVAGQAAQNPGPVTPANRGPLMRAMVSTLEVKVAGVQTTAPTPSGTTTIVTLDLEQPTEFGTGLTEMLITALAESNRYVLLERPAADDPLPDPNAEGIGKLTPQILIKGAITELKLRRSGLGAGAQVGETISASSTQVDASVGLDLRIVEVATGRILSAVKADGKARSSRKSFTFSQDEFTIGTASFDQGPLSGAVRSAIEKAVAKIAEAAAKTPWEARVADVEDKTIYLNAGKESGLKPGDLLQFEKPGRTLLDPDSKAIIGRTRGKVIGKLKILEVEPGFSKAEIIEGSEATVGDYVRWLKPVEAESQKGDS